MKINNRLYTYPILSEEKEDYISSVFEVESKISKNGVSQINVCFNIKMNNKEIQQLIREGSAEYVMHVECSSTSYRTTVRGASTTLELDIPVGRIVGKVELMALIVAKRDIQDFYIYDWDDDFEGMKFNFSKGNILGYKNMSYFELLKNFDELGDISSIVKVCKLRDEKVTLMNVELDKSEAIKIHLPAKDYELYIRYNKNPQFQPILNSMLVFPALVYTFDELMIDGNISIYENKDWFRSLEKAYKEMGSNLVEEILSAEKTSIVLAQQAMELPISNALTKLSELSD